MTSANRDIGVDFLRAACILYVVGYWHLIPYTEALPGYANLYTESLKYIALATFVFCSGFLLARARVTLDPAGLWSFYRRRLVRIYPLYLLALVLFWVAGVAPLEQLVQGALLISMFHPPALPTLWFITMIMIFYLLAPLVIRAAERPTMGVLVGLAVLVVMALVHLLIHPIDLRPLLYWPVFVLAILYQRVPGLKDWLTRQRVPLAVLVLPAVFAIQGGDEVSIAGIAQALPISVIGTLALFIYAPTIARPLPAQVVLLLAYSSFGLYLFHRVTFHWAIALYFPADGVYQVLYLLLLVTPLTILLGYAIQTLYDRALAALEPARAPAH